MRKFLSFTLCLIMAISSAFAVACDIGGTTTPPDNGNNSNNSNPSAPDNPTPDTPSDTPTSTEFVPITRFVVTSDVHVRENGALESLYRLETIFDTAYEYSDEHSTYKELDAIFFAGDNTDNGYQTEQQLFFNTVSARTRTGTVVKAVMGNHEFYATKTSDGSYSPESMQQAPIKFLEYSGYDSTDAHLVIDGYHYILLSMDKYGNETGLNNQYLSQQKLDWLENELNLALADDPTGDKPIFVFQHVPPKDTMLGSIYYDTYLRELLNDYPNVVDFAGHTHMPMTDQRSIWQGEFTALQTGAMSYLDVTLAGHQKYDQAGVYQIDDDLNYSETFFNNATRNGNMYYIVEINADNVVKIQIMDAINNEIYGHYIIDSFGNPAGFDYTDAREDNDVKPEFSSNDSITVVSNDYQKTVVTFPQATCAEKVNHYRINIEQNGVLIKTDYKPSGEYLGRSKPTTLKATINALEPATTYTLKIYPVSTWAVSGNPIIVELTTTNEETISPDILCANFLANGIATNKVTSNTLTKTGAPTTSLYTDLNRYVADFNGYSAYLFGMNNFYDDIESSFTLEVLFNADYKPSSGYQDIFSNQQAGGFGFEYNSKGEVEFIICVYGSYVNVSVPITTDTWTHLIGTYDGQTLKLYMNGNLVGSKSVAGKLTIPSTGAQNLVIGGDSTSNNSANNFFDGKIAIANLYSKVLTATQVFSIYSSIN